MNRENSVCSFFQRLATVKKHARARRAVYCGFVYCTPQITLDVSQYDERTAHAADLSTIRYVKIISRNESAVTWPLETKCGLNYGL